MNKKVKYLARKSALSYMAKDQNIIVLEDFSFNTPKTKSYTELLSNFDLLDNKKLKGECVLLVGKDDKNVYFE